MHPFDYIGIVKLSFLLNFEAMKFLIVDDHPMTVEGYKNAIANSFGDVTFTVASDCKAAYTEIQKARGVHSFEIAFIDKNIPEYTDEKLFSGIDIAALIKSTLPHCKIIFITAHTEYLVIYDIYKKIKPEGLVSKGELTPQNLISIINTVRDGEDYASPLVKECIKEIWMKELMVDDYNRQILYYMSKGYKIKELGSVIFLATSTIQRRVLSMKEAFNVPDESSLVKVAVKQGFI